MSKDLFGVKLSREKKEEIALYKIKLLKESWKKIAEIQQECAKEGVNFFKDFGGLNLSYIDILNKCRISLLELRGE